jgi:hypothetical protein
LSWSLPRPCRWSEMPTDSSEADLERLALLYQPRLNVSKVAIPWVTVFFHYNLAAPHPYRRVLLLNPAWQKAYIPFTDLLKPGYHILLHLILLLGHVIKLSLEHWSLSNPSLPTKLSLHIIPS